MATEYLSVGSLELIHLSEYEEYFALAKSYINASHKLCQSIIDGSFDNTHTNSMVIMSLSCHSYELFLKGSIIYKSQNVTKSHRVDQLIKQYNVLYPDNRDKLPHLFNVTNLTDKEELTEEGFQCFDQSFRYTRDRKGNPWVGGQGFNASLYVTQLNKFILIMNELITQIANEDKIKHYPVVAYKNNESSWTISFVDAPIQITESKLEVAMDLCQEAFEEFMRNEEALPSPTPVDLVVDREEKKGTVVGVVDIDTTFFKGIAAR